MLDKTKKWVITFSNLGYVAGCIIIYLIALCILGSAVWSIVAEMCHGSYTVYKLLDEVGLIVFSMAVVDIGKYLILEEVIRKGKIQMQPEQSRRALTKFAIIITSALSLEGLVLTIEVAARNISELLYPVAIILTATLYIVGIGLYQKLNVSAEKH